MINDGLANVLAGVGTERDKAAASYYTPPEVSAEQLSNAYRTSWVARKIVDIPALDSCRNWRSWQATQDQITAIEGEEKRLNLKAKVLQARTIARLLGGSAIYADYGDDAGQALDLAKIGKGKLRFLTVFTKEQLLAGPLIADPLSEFYGLPEHFSIAGGQSGSVKIHPSRLTIFKGTELPAHGLSEVAYQWGDSVLVSTLDAVKRAESAAANVSSLIFEANVDVISIEGLTDILRQTGGEQKVKDLIDLNLTAKSNLRALILDAKNAYDRKPVSFGSLADLMDRFDQHAAGAADIPMTRFMGMSPGGLNSSGDSDLRNYYDRVNAGQTLEMGPAMMRLDEGLIRSALGARDPAIFYDWNPLWQMSEKEKADIFKTKADAARVIAGNGGTSEPLMPIEALSDALVNELIEDGSLSGLEAAIEQYGKLSVQGDDGDEDEEAAMGALPAPDKPAHETLAAKDAAPRTLYVSRKLLNADDLIEWAKAHGFEVTVPADEMHVTIAYSRRPVDWMKAGDSWNNDKNGNLTVNPGGARLVEPLGREGAIVLLFSSSELSWRHEAIKRDAEATWDYPSYQPHVTFTMSEQGVDLAKVEPYRGKLVFGPEIFAELDDNWSSKLTEE